MPDTNTPSINLTQQGGSERKTGTVATGAPLLVLKKLDKWFGATHALKAVDLVFKAGEIHAIVGENGAGKSTLIKLLTEVHVRTSGEVYWEGQPVALATPHEAINQALTLNPVVFTMSEDRPNPLSIDNGTFISDFLKERKTQIYSLERIPQIRLRQKSPRAFRVEWLISQTVKLMIMPRENTISTPVQAAGIRDLVRALTGPGKLAYESTLSF
jgi:energy-coupling factor transporter ATP-binding protein EcfA2